jgi:hypothetical protein
VSWLPPHTSMQRMCCSGRSLTKEGSAQESDRTQAGVDF